MTGILHRRAVLAVAAATLAAVTVVLVYLAVRAQVRAVTVPLEKLSIALPILPHTAMVHIAEIQGYFTEEGLAVTMLPSSYGVAAIGELTRSTADIAVAGDVPFVIAVMNGDDLGIVANLAAVTDDNVIIARRDHGIAAAADLSGKTIGVSFGSGSSYFLRAYLIRNKLSPDSIALVDLPPDRIVQSLTEGKIDAVATRQPISFGVQSALGANAVTFSGGKDFQATIVMVGRTGFLNAHASAIEKLARAMLKAEGFMHAHPEDTLRLVATWLKADAGMLQKTWGHFEFKVAMPQVQLVALEDEARWAMSRGYAPRGPVPNFLPHLYLAALTAAWPERVTVLR